MVKLSKNGKRLGRPPKNSKGIVFISAIPKKEEIAIPPINSESMIECQLLDIPQYSHMKSDIFKHGRYMTSIYSIDGFGRNKWVVGAYLKIDPTHSSAFSDEELVKRCVNYLNSLTINKKGKKKYGNLQLYKFNRLNKNGQQLICVQIITDERSNDNFWGEGERL